MSDEYIEEETSTESSTETNNPENVTEDDKKSGQMIPKSRFDEVNTAKKKLEERIAQLESATSTKPIESNKPFVDESWKKWMEFTIENKELDKEQLITAKRLFEAGTPLSKVLEDPLYVAFSEKHQKEKQENASTATAGRSSKVLSDKPISEMTRAEHEAYFKKHLGK